MYHVPGRCHLLKVIDWFDQSFPAALLSTGRLDPIDHSSDTAWAEVTEKGTGTYRVRIT
jgi:hypothetical protein